MSYEMITTPMSPARLRAGGKEEHAMPLQLAKKRQKDSLDPRTRRLLRDLALMLVDPDDTTREAAMIFARVAAQRRALREPIFDDLLAALREPDRQVRLMACAALGALGWPVLGFLALELIKARSIAWRLRVAETLADVGPRLERSLRLQLFLTLDYVRDSDTSEAVAKACGRAITAMALDQDHDGNATVSAATGTTADSAAEQPS